jgi:hypothetical protein
MRKNYSCPTILDHSTYVNKSYMHLVKHNPLFALFLCNPLYWLRNWKTARNEALVECRVYSIPGATFRCRFPSCRMPKMPTVKMSTFRRPSYCWLPCCRPSKMSNDDPIGLFFYVTNYYYNLEQKRHFFAKFFGEYIFTFKFIIGPCRKFLHT